MSYDGCPHRFQRYVSNARMTHTSGLSYGCGFGEDPSDATEQGYANLLGEVDSGKVRNLADFVNRLAKARRPVTKNLHTHLDSARTGAILVLHWMMEDLGLLGTKWPVFPFPVGLPGAPAVPSRRLIRLRLFDRRPWPCRGGHQQAEAGRVLAPCWKKVMAPIKQYIGAALQKGPQRDHISDKSPCSVYESLVITLNRKPQTSLQLQPLPPLQLPRSALLDGWQIKT